MSTRPLSAVVLGLLAGLGTVIALRRRRLAPTVPPGGAPAALPGRPRLVEVAGGSLPHGHLDAEPAEVLLPLGRTLVGRVRDADLRLSDTSVSPRHALLAVEPDGRVVVHDLGAANGVSVDGIPVAEVELHDGNRLQLGDTTLVYRVDPVAGDDGGRQGGELGEHADLDTT